MGLSLIQSSGWTNRRIFSQQSLSYYHVSIQPVNCSGTCHVDVGLLWREDSMDDLYVSLRRRNNRGDREGVSNLHHCGSSSRHRQGSTSKHSPRENHKNDHHIVRTRIIFGFKMVKPML